MSTRSPHLFFAASLLFLLPIFVVGDGGRELKIEPVDAPLQAVMELVPDSSSSARGWRRQIATPWRTLLGEATSGRLEVGGEGLWPCTLTIAPGREKIELLAVPKGQVRGSLHLPAGFAPAGVELKLARTPIAGRPTPNVACGDRELTLSCPLVAPGKAQAEPSFNCEVPRGTFDVRWSIPGLAPQTAWELEFGAATDVGALSFTRGGAISGRVERRPGVAEPIEMTLIPAAFSSTDAKSTSGERLERMSQRIQADTRGAFRFQSLVPGTYRLEAKAAGASPTMVDEVVVRAEAETDLGPALVLTPPARWQVTVDPPRDAAGAPWTLVLSQQRGGDTFEREIARGKTGEEGGVVFASLNPGSYRIEALDGEGSSLFQSTVEITADPPPYWIEIELVEVRGRLLLGKAGVAGKVVFGAHERPRVTLAADEEGLFHGYLPRPGVWSLLVDEVDSQSSFRLPPIEVEPNASGCACSLEIRLPATTLRGKVVEDGRAVEGATVMLMPAAEGDAGRDRRASVLSAADGGFLLRGARPGRYRLGALHGHKTSEWQEVTLEEEIEPPAVEIELGRQLRLQGTIVAAGRPVPNAAFLWSDARDIDRGFYRRSTAGLDGRVEVLVQPSVPTLTILAFAPGAGIQLASVDTSQPTFVLDLGEPSGLVQIVATGGLEQIQVHRGSAHVPLGILSSALASMAPQRTPAFNQLLGLATGSWTICQPPPAGCAAIQLFAGVDEVVDVSSP